MMEEADTADQGSEGYTGMDPGIPHAHGFAAAYTHRSADQGSQHCHTWIS
jgi:hypothetical protein